MLRFVLILFLLLANVFSQAQNLPSSRSTDWTKVGLKYMPDNSKAVLNVMDYGAFPNGENSNDSMLQSLINSIPANDSSTIFFPNGRYRFEQTISMKSHLTLLGESSDSTIILFDLSNEGHAINFNGSASNIQSNLSQDAHFGNSQLVVQGAHLFQVGDFIRVLDNDASLVTSSWAVGSTGQIAQITNIQGDTLYIDALLRRDFSASSGHVAQLNMLQHSGIENLQVIRIDPDQSQSSIFYFNYSANCFLKCIRSFQCNKAHVNMYNSAHNLVSGSYFKDAHSYGSGGKAYGVLLQSATSECLVSNNNFEHLRHSMIVQAGANGNVFSYNYSTDPYWTDVSLPSSSAGDIVLHGNYPYLNLFEGNVVQNIIIDDSHGANGKFNTFLRNRAELYGIFMNNGTPSDSQNFIGNEIPNTTFLMGFYQLCGNGHFAYGNNHKGNTKPSGTSQVSLESLYLSSPPAYYQYHLSWPPIGLPNTLEEHLNETQQRREWGQFTTCDSEIDAQIMETDSEIMLDIFPNPAQNELFIQFEGKSFSEAKIFNSHGAIVQRSNQNPIHLNTLKPGFYVVQVEVGEKLFCGKFVKE